MIATIPCTTILSPDDLKRCTTIAEQGAGAVKAYVDAVSVQTGIPSRQFYALTRDRGEVSEARQLIMFAAHRGGVSIRQIAIALNRDRSTVLHGIRREAERRGQE